MNSNHHTQWTACSLESLKAKPGCYAIYCDGRLSYIGTSKNVRNRLDNHGIRLGYSNDSIVTPWGWFRSFSIKTKYEKRLKERLSLELKLIKRLKPRFNKAGVSQ